MFEFSKFPFACISMSMARTSKPESNPEGYSLQKSQSPLFPALIQHKKKGNPQTEKKTNHKQIGQYSEP